MAYSAHVEVVKDRLLVRVPVPVELKPFHCLQDESPWVEELPGHVDVPLLPWVCDCGAIGCAGWALVGTTLRGFVLDGPDAGLVKWDLTARLDRLLVALESGSEAGVEFVRAAERGDRSKGQERVKAMRRDLAWFVSRLPKS